MVWLILTFAFVACECNGGSTASISATSAMPATPISPAGTTAGGSDIWSETDSLPLLTRKLLQPITEQSKFDDSMGILNFRNSPKPRPPTEEPFATDAEAVNAAQAWIESHFGKLVPALRLELKHVDHSSSGGPTPRFDWDRGHTIVFKEIYRGIPTDGGAVIYITGRTKFSASISLYSYAPVAGSGKPLVTKQAAIAAWRTLLKQRGSASDVLARFDNGVQPHLLYVWSPLANRGSTGEEFVVPTWALEQEDLYMVDGHTGKAWYND